MALVNLLPIGFGVMQSKQKEKKIKNICIFHTNMRLCVHGSRLVDGLLVFTALDRYNPYNQNFFFFFF